MNLQTFILVAVEEKYVSFLKVAGLTRTPFCSKSQTSIYSIPTRFHELVTWRELTLDFHQFVHIWVTYRLKQISNRFYHVPNENKCSLGSDSWKYFFTHPKQSKNNFQSLSRQKFTSWRYIFRKYTICFSQSYYYILYKLNKIYD